MYSSPEHVSMDYDEQASPRARGAPSLYLQPNTKTCVFYKDGDPTFPGVKLAVNPRYYQNIDTLHDQLTEKIKELHNGVRSIHTPGGRHMVTSIHDLENQGKYVCSSKRQAKGLNLTHVGLRPWHAGKPPSGRRRYNIWPDPLQRHARKAWMGSKDHDPYPFRNAPKKITVIKNAEPMERHVLLLNRRTLQTFEQILSDLSEMFHMPVRRIYTAGGRPVFSLSAIFNGPEMYVVTSGDRFQPVSSSMSDPGTAHPPHPLVKRKAYTGDGVHQKLKDRREKLSRTRGKWKVWVTTNELPSAGTEAQVSITVYGHKGNSGPIPLGYAKGETFQPGNIDEFEISVGNIGEIYKIRVAHDNSGDYASWFCDEVRMRDVHTQEQLVFDCRRWLSRDEEDAEICRELPAARNDEQVLPIVNYDVTLTTGDLWNAGTSANVYITIYGERGDTGVRQLYLSTKQDKFGKGQTDTFTVEAVSLGNLKRVIIGHDGTVPGDGWYLEKVVVKESAKSQFEWVFPCHRWLDEGEEDGKIVRELKPLTEYNLDKVEKQRWKTEEWKFQNDNCVMLYSKLTQRPIRINPDSSVDVCAEYVDDQAIMRVIAKRDMVRVLQSCALPNCHLGIDNARVIGQGRGGPHCELMVRVQEDRSVMFASTKYKNQHMNFLSSGKPGDPRGSAGDPSMEFHVYCKGVFRDKGVVMLCTSVSQTLNIDHDNMVYATGRRNKLAHFRVHKVSEGNIRMFESVVFPNQFIRIKDGQVDCNGSGDRMCHFKVERVKEKGYVCLESLASRGIYVGMVPDGRVRPTVNTGDKNVRFFPEVIEFGIPKGSDLKPSPPPVQTKPRKARARKHSPSPTPRRSSPVPHKRRTPTPPPPKSPTPEPQRVESARSTFEDGDWKLWITSLENADNANIAMVVYGDRSNSGPISLGSSKDSQLFRAQNQDQFKANLAQVGKIYKIRLELTPVHTNRDPVWKVKEVKMQDMTTKETLKFKFNRWLSRDHDDREIMRELPAVRPRQNVLSVFHYQVHVYTGSEVGADTDANVYLVLFGERGDTGKRLLLQSDNDNMFQEGQLDIFELEAVDLGKLKRAVVSHDGEGSGEGWYCEQILVRESVDSTHEYVFPCDKWLDSGIDDGKTERVLKVKEPAPCPIKFLDDTDDDADIESVDDEHRPIPQQDERSPTPPPEEAKPEPGEWNVWLTTGQDHNNGTVNDVTLYVYGDDGCSDPLTLASGKDFQYFQPGHTDTFKVNLGTDLGELYKIRVGHSDTDRKSGWFLEKVKMQNLTTNETLTFKVKRWMWRQEDDSDVWRELPVVLPGQQPLPVITYTVEVYTGSQPGSETEANVYIQLMGSRGDTGKRLLYKSATNWSKFQEGQLDIFQVEAVSLDEVESVIIGHDGHGRGAGWYLEKVIVKEGDQPGARMFYFPCDRWLDEGQDDGLIERELQAAEPPKQSMGEYAVWVKTHRDSKPSQDSAVIFTAYGDKGKSRDIELTADKPVFQPGNTDQFQVSLGDIGELYKIRLARTRDDQGWHLQQVKLQDKDTKEETLFVFDRWMDRDQDDHDIVRERPLVKNKKEVLPMQTYEVTVHTGDHWAAETDANVYLTLYGSKGDSGKRCLYHSLTQTNKFQRNKVDSFLLEAVSVEDLQRVVIGHDGVGHGAGWFLDKVVVREMQGQNTNKMYVFHCGRWLDDHEDDGKKERELSMIDVLDEGDKPIEPKKGSKTQGQWQVEVTTSDVHNAGTHAQVTLTVYGSKGSSDPKPLTYQDDQDQFERNQLANFTVNVGDIGDIYKVRIEHDNTGDFPSWHLDKIVMTDKHTKQQVKFYADRWLSQDDDDGATARELVPVTTGKTGRPVLRYYVAVYTGDMNEADTTANVSLTVFGQYGDSGQHVLSDSKTHNFKFLHGQVDVFSLESVHLGRLDHIVLEHDGKNKDTAWFVEKVVIKESEHALTEHIFPSHSWMEAGSKRKPARLQVGCLRQQPASSLPHAEQVALQKDTSSKGQWLLTTTTAQHDEAPTDTDVFMVVYGTKCQTDPLRLQDYLQEEPQPATTQNTKPSREKKKKPKPVKQEKKKPFASGHVDVFKLDVGNVGDIYKIRITVDMKGKMPAWNIDKLKMKDIDTQQEFHFVHSGVLGGSADSEDYTLELPAIRPDLPPLQDVTYMVSVTTGNVPLAETEATVLCTVVGEWGDTGPRPFTAAKNNDTKFQRDQTDVFELRALDLGQLKKIVMSHSAHGRGRGWFCERVTVMEGEDADIETIFPCHRWLDTGCDDRRLERVLLPLAAVKTAAQPAKKLKSEGRYKCLLGTAGEGSNSNNNNSNNNNNNNSNNNNNTDLNTNNNSNGRKSSQRSGQKSVSVTVYGSKGVKNGVVLDNGDPDMFTAGSQDEFELNVGDIGNIHKIRVNNKVENDADAVWDVSEVTLLDQDTKEKLDFDFSPWVGQRGVTSCELPAVRPGQEVPPVIEYRLAVTTGGEEEEDFLVEEADVYVRLHGSHGDSGRRHLLKNKENKPLFQPGQTETFCLDAVDLGDIERVTITKGAGDDWHILKIAVKAGEFAATETIFSYDRLIEDEDEVVVQAGKTLISQVAVPVTMVPHLPRTRGIWKVWTKTGDKPKMKVSSGVMVTLCGDKQESSAVALVAQDSDNPFMPGETDEFLVRVKEDIGDLVKVRLAFADRSKRSNWYLEHISFQDQDTHDEFTADVSDWIVVDEEKDGVKEIAAVWPGTHNLPNHIYQISTVTGEQKNAGTAATVYIEIQGQTGSTGKRQLKKSQQHQVPFQEGQTDYFLLESADLMDIQKVWIGHDGKKKGAGWFLQTVTVSKEESAPEYTFQCGRWLEKTEDDGAIERWLELSDRPPPPPSPPPPPGDEWRVWTTTGRDKKATSTGEIVMVIYGRNGKTAETPVGQEQSNKFQRGKTEEFEVRCKPNLGEIYKVRLGFMEDSPQDSSWQLDRLKLQHQESGAVYEFDVRSWLTQSATKDSWLEIPVRNNKPELMLPVIQYEVQVYTGDMEDGGTDAKVHLTIFGEQGDTGCRRLLKSLNNADSNFNEGQMDAFEVEAVDLQQLKHIVIGHNGTGAGNGWFLDKVVIQDNSPEKKKYVFQCNRWLDEAQDDCKIERKLKVKQGVLWQIVTQTSEEEASGCVGPATVVLYGQHGCSLPFTIGTDQDFSFGDTDTARDQFEVQVEYPEDVEDLGDLYKVRIGFEREEIDDEKLWNLEQIRLRHVVRKQEYVFELHDWIELLENNDSWRELPVNTRHKQDLLPIHKYWVQVWTSERGGAGTDAEVYLQISGERGDTGVRKLLKCHEPGTCFQAGKLDRFEVEAVDMQDLTQVVVGHNGKGVGAGWHLDKVLISESAEADKQYLFECDRWLDEGEDDTLTERILPLTKVIQKETDEEWKVWTTTGKHKEAGTQAQVVLAIYGERGCSHEIPLGENTNRKKLFGKSKTDDFLVKVKADIGEIYKIRIGFSEEELRKRPAWQVDKVKLQRLKTGEVYEFEVRDWIQTTTDRDGWREIQPTSEKPQDLSQVHKYQVEVFTGEQTGAGTDANVHLTICGERGDTGKRHLWTPINHKDRKFEAGNRDVFEVEAVDLKQLKTVTVGHDGKGFGSGWFLEKIIIREQPDDQKKYVFRCDRWLDEDEDDGLTERQLKVKEGVPWKIVTYSKQEGEEDDSPEGPATLVLYGEDGHSEPVQFATDVDFTFATDGPQDQFQVKVEYVNDIEDIGQLYKVRVGFQRDDEDTDVFWNLEKLKLENLDTGEEFEFELNDWIKLTEVSDSWRELPVKGDKQPQQQDEDEDVEADGKDKDDRKEDLQVHKYWVEVYTADKTGAGTDAQVCLQIFGERGDTGQRKLLRSLQPGARFEAGKMDVFEIEAVDMKDLQRVVVGHDGKGLGAGWYLDKIIIGHCENADRKFLFNCDRWLDEGEDDGLLERELKLTEILEDEEIKEGDWRVYVITSGDDNSGTLGQVTLTIFGEDGDTGALPLGEPASGLFETSDADQFDIWVEPEDVGKLTKIRIEHDAREPGKGWKLERIVMENRFDPEETLEFDVDRWLDVGEDDGDVMRELAAEWPDEDPLPVTKYKVQTFTGKASGGGTDAPVYITLCGENGDSGKRYLAKNQEGRKKFDKGKTDSFLLEAIDLGELNKVTIGHDGEGVKTGWYLDQVIITDEDKDEKYVFPCSNWLSEKQGDGKKERELTGQK